MACAGKSMHLIFSHKIIDVDFTQAGSVCAYSSDVFLKVCRRIGMEAKICPCSHSTELF